MFQVFVDSAANLPAVTAKKYDIHVVSFVNLVNAKDKLQQGDKTTYGKTENKDRSQK